MLFNSYEFIFIFLPLCLLAFFSFAKFNSRISIAFLVVASLGFYAWWKVEYLVLILGSIVFNYWFGEWVSAQPGKRGSSKQKLLLTIGVISNLALLGYFKYTNFMIDQLNFLVGWDKFHLEQILLPLAISFFTFQQIAYLVDSFRGEIEEHSFLQYCLFVTFFPQLIAGPIVHHKEMLPQFTKPETFRPSSHSIAVGLTLFSIGLFKKVVIADNVAVYSTPIFAAADTGQNISLAESWIATLAYTLQLYFDFSGYSDMALGLARMFGVKLPENFNSPYKSTSIIEFWRRWHMTLSRFLRDYLYIALGGNRKGDIRRYTNLFLTMLLGGIWHGAGWNFVIWGVLHGSYLMINHGWKKIRKLKPEQSVSASERHIYWLVTLLAVMIAWVFFRAETTTGALNILSTMLGNNLETETQLVDIKLALTICIPALILSLYAPNSLFITGKVDKYLSGSDNSQSSNMRSSLIAINVALLFWIPVGMLGKISEFLYFNF